MMEGGIRILIPTTIFALFFALPFLPSAAISSENQDHKDKSRTYVNGNKGNYIATRSTIELNSGPEDLVWLVQLSDLHFSVHHPDRARDFREIVGPTLSFVNPSLVLLTGDLTDGKSKDLLTMKQDEEEWIEYQKVMHNVVKMSGLNESIFYDVRGNHDNFGVPVIGGFYDFFTKYSFNGQLKRRGNVNSITIQTSKRKLLFVGFDSTLSSGLRGPTNLFGHPTDELLTDINSELSQWDSQSAQPVIKISFGHFPLSFSAASKSGKTLKDLFLVHSLSAYLCGHLHTKFGNNLKRHHYSTHHHLYPEQLFQLNGHRFFSENAANCSNATTKIKEFWEWELGDWRKSRAMRILAIDGGHLSFVDINFKLGAKKTIILPTFPLDSRFTTSSFQCGTANTLSYGAVRALIFSASPIISVVARIYDSSSGKLDVVMEATMIHLEGSRGDLYVTPWNIKDFEDPSSERFLLQIEATDIGGRSTISELRPFSVSGLPAKFPWNWKEFFVMGCQWDSLYYPIIWCFYFLVLSILLIPKLLLSFSKRQYTYKNFKANKGVVNGMAWIFGEVHKVPVAWWGMIGYLFYLVLCPWFSGQVFTQGGEVGYMTYRGWLLRSHNFGEFLGFPDVMVVVLPHLYLVVFPTIIAIMILAAERGMYCDYLLSLSSKKKDDYDGQNKEDSLPNNFTNRRLELVVHKRWLRKFLLVVSLAVFWTHFKNCRALMKAYEINSITRFPLYSLAVPAMFCYTVWKTGKTQEYFHKVD